MGSSATNRVIDMQEGLLRYLFDEIKNRGPLDDGGASLSVPGRIPRILHGGARDHRRGRRQARGGDISPEGEKILCSHFEKERGSQFVYVVGYGQEAAHVHHAG